MQKRRLLKRATFDDAEPLAASGTGTGYVDSTEGGRIEGWAADTANPNVPLEIEIYLGDQVIASGRADGFREDLLQAGMGDGKHAFSCVLPRRLGGVPKLEISVRVKGWPAPLPHSASGQTLIEAIPAPLLKFVAADLVDNCNLRCPFCLVDYSAVKKTEWMTEETFRKLLGLIPCVPEEGFWLSCLHEPTLHPRLNDFIGMIPEAARSKFWFTTNLARPLSEEVLRGWAESGLHHINVSLDTMNPALFAVLRKFGRYEVFKRNLDRLAAIFRVTPNAPKMRYITMAFRSNLEEIPEIVRHAHEQWLASDSEVRYTFNMGHISDEFRREHYLKQEDWAVLDERLSGLPYRHTITRPPESGYEERVFPAANFFDLLKLRNHEKNMQFEHPISLRGRPDGSLLLAGRECDWSVNVHDLGDPVEFFRNL